MKLFIFYCSNFIRFQSLTLIAIKSPKSLDFTYICGNVPTEDLQKELLSSYRMNEMEKITKTKRELTDEETEKIQELCKKLADKFK